MLEKLEINCQNISQYAKFLFNILADNMYKISTTNNSRDEDFQIWFENLQERLLNEKCFVIAFLHYGNVIGYLQYSISENTLMIEEVEISPKFLIRYNILGNVIKILSEISSENITYVEAYANKNNKISMQILRKAGFQIVGTNKNKTSYLHKTTFSELVKRFKLS